MPAESHLHRKPLPIAELLRTLEFDTALAYKASDFHSPEHEAGIRRDDPSIEIAWPLNQRNFGLSQRDSKLSLLSEVDWLFQAVPR